MASTARPFVISDSGDNPTAGGAGDLPYMLGRLLAHEELAGGRVTALHPGLTDPEAVAVCCDAGVGAEVTLRVGGRFSAGTGPHAEPYELTGTVTALDGPAASPPLVDRGAIRRTTGAAGARRSPAAGSPSY
ncbi:MlrC C-terminal domain-containing protein [Streptomyces lydicus]|nr:MlrC C-terminal domain-containing protein [Streptomyces lydicus]